MCARVTDSDLGGVHQRGPAGGAEAGDHIGKRVKSQTTVDATASAGEERPDLADGTGDGRPVHLEPAGQYVVGDAVSQMYECGQEPVGEDQLVLRARSDRSPAWSVE
ncbi:hypothetical protein Sdia_39090 [Streptomyces diastaticus subsp. diastaticus]|uniref:Uncharacterized protein n=1 Tax=Streptomyces diastaticus subsp. diastaticus TaxID=68040 RepID=A0ABQ1CS34_STRDI|nr:hypothetical protein Sdia_39090 [Streptomyces diastaticus subsp. diastaticus]GGU24784.1 hypothetical protein GCM10015534_29240 [Streptomyces diastaticus subsp. diastaticus]